MSPGKMEDVLYDYHLAHSMGGLSGDSVEFRRMVYVEAVFQKYKISRAEFDTSLVWYSRHTGQLYNIYKNIEERLGKEANLLGAQTNVATTYSQLSNKGDTANVWSGRNFYCLTTKDANNLMSFNIKADTSYYPKDRLLWHFRSHFVYQSGHRDAIVSLSVRYDNDSVGTVTQHLYSDNDFSITLDLTDRKIKRVYGFVYHNAPWTKEEKILLLTDLSLVRFHKPKENLVKNDTLLVADSTKVSPSISVADSVPASVSGTPVHAAPIPIRKQLIKRNVID